MNDILPFLVSGTAVGAVYGLAGTGLVLTYKTSGIFNFGHGALATIAAYLFYALHVVHGIDWRIAAAVTILVAGPVLGLAMEVFARGLAHRPVAMKIVGTVGLILAVQGAGSLLYGPDLINVEDFLPKAGETFPLGGINVRYQYLTITVLALVAVAALQVLFRFTRTGLAMRAVVDDPDLLGLKGTSPMRVRRTAWVVGSMFAALSGVLVLPLSGLEPISLTFLVVVAFGAAAIGGFSSIPLTFVGGILLGIGSDVVKPYVVDVSWLSGLPSSLPFVVLFVVLMFLRQRRGQAGAPERRPRLEWRAPVRVRLVTSAVVLAGFAVVPALAGDKLGFFTVGLTQIILLLSLGLLVRTSGQVSLCHAVFGAIGAVAFSQFMSDFHLPWAVALLLGGLVAVPVGALVALPAIRLSGLYLGLATFGFAIMVERLLYPLNFMFTPLAEGRSMPRPSFATGDDAYYYLVLVLVVLAAVIVEAVTRGRLGRMSRGMAESPVAVATAGLSTGVTKVIVFCLSAFLAAIAGVLYGSSVQTASTTDPHFTSFSSLTLLVILAIAPFGPPWGAVFMGMTAVIPAFLTGADTGFVLNMVFGISAIVVSVGDGPPSPPVWWRSFLNRIGGRAAKPATVTPPDPRPSPHPAVHTNPREGLKVEGLTVRYGGLTAVDGLTLHAPPGRVTGLIGPNGSGKTTTFDACSGLTAPGAGRITLHGADVTRLGLAARGRAGLGRTFQNMALCESLTVEENVALGHESGLAGRNVLNQLVASPKRRAETRAAAWSAMELCGITELAGRQAGALSIGHRRLVELARCLAGPFDLLLLDEPSSGLDRAETTAFAEVVNRVVEERGIGVLLVEHDMPLVMSMCEHIYVLDVGALLFEGTPEAVRSSDRVRAAYLGRETTQIEESPR
jgi:ABC-type branched-subunit amino acid transport system ATPase component/branched-subunit amino acid ABC-type transport system permease component